MQAKILFVITAIMLCMLPNSFAQTDSPDCDVCWCKSDGTCDGNADCIYGTSCTALTFTAPCTDYYCFKCFIYCNGGGACGNCFSCAALYEEGQSIPDAVCQTIGCNNDPADCDYDFCTDIQPPNNYVKLTANTNYKLYVCLKPCIEGGNTCEDCASNCKAVAIVYKLGASCVPPASCN